MERARERASLFHKGHRHGMRIILETLAQEGKHRNKKTNKNKSRQISKNVYWNEAERSLTPDTGRKLISIEGLFYLVRA